MPINILKRPLIFSGEFVEADEGLVLQYGHAKLCLKLSGEITLQNAQASISLSPSGELILRGDENVIIQSEKHIHLNTKE